MNRIIKCRGKRKNSSEWIFGFYNEFPTPNSDEKIPFILHDTTMTEVLPETVGQFTGLLDKNEKEIYEGDLIHRYMRVYWRVVFKDNKWIAESIKNSGLYLSGQQFVESEIIGNIHDQKPLEDKA